MQIQRLKDCFEKIKTGDIILIQEFEAVDDDATIFQPIEPLVYSVTGKTFFTAKTLMVRRTLTDLDQEEFLDDFGPNLRIYVLAKWTSTTFKEEELKIPIRSAIALSKAKDGSSISEHFRGILNNGRDLT